MESFGAIPDTSLEQYMILADGRWQATAPAEENGFPPFPSHQEHSIVRFDFQKKTFCIVARPRGKSADDKTVLNAMNALLNYLGRSDQVYSMAAPNKWDRLYFSADRHRFTEVSGRLKLPLVTH